MFVEEKMAAAIMLGLTALGGLLLLFSFFSPSDPSRMIMLVSGLGIVFAGILFGLKK
ncbi:MAG: hypothetical protein HMLIMOIP_001164 [Candidatus Nitrosomirales archaeon]